MFAFEIAFREGGTGVEALLVRRNRISIGAESRHDVAIEDLASLPFELEVSRRCGRRFSVSATPRGDAGAEPPAGIVGEYNGATEIALGPVTLGIVALDVDLAVREQESPDRAGVRVLRQGLATATPEFPAVVLLTTPPSVVSFPADESVFIGRAKTCGVRIDAAEVSMKHARMGFEDGAFWIEDLGSTNGTFLGDAPLSGRQRVAPNTPIFLGGRVAIVGVATAGQLLDRLQQSAPVSRSAETAEIQFPALVCRSEVARPQRLVVRPGSRLTIGRDPACDLWLGVPHVSRSHCSVVITESGGIQITDSSTNGTGHSQGLLKKGESIEFSDAGNFLDFTDGLRVFLCFSAEEERALAEIDWDVGGKRSLEDTGNHRRSEIAVESIPRAPALRRPTALESLRELGEAARVMFQTGGFVLRAFFVLSGIVFIGLFTVIMAALLPLFG